jgi:hypothetical protein
MTVTRSPTAALFANVVLKSKTMYSPAEPDLGTRTRGTLGTLGTLRNPKEPWNPYQPT